MRSLLLWKLKSIGNKGKVNGAIAARYTKLRFDENTHIFVDNEGDVGGAIGLDNSKLEFGGYVPAYIKVIRNRAQTAGGAIFAQGFIVIIKSHTSLLFSGNIGYKGGALALIGNSFIKLKAPINVLFLKNHTEHSGGAIYVKDYRIESFNKGDLPRCFFSNTRLLPHNVIRFIFRTTFYHT